MSREEIRTALWPKRRSSKLLERDIQAAILEYLNLLPGVRAYRRNTGAFTGTYKGKTRFVRFSQPGAADIWGIGPGGVHLEIEVTRPLERPSDEQSLWLADMANAGCVAFWADSLDSCIKQLEAEYQKRGWSQNRMSSSCASQKTE